MQINFEQEKLRQTLTLEAVLEDSYSENLLLADIRAMSLADSTGCCLKSENHVARFSQVLDALLSSELVFKE